MDGFCDIRLVLKLRRAVWGQRMRYMIECVIVMCGDFSGWMEGRGVCDWIIYT